MSSTVFLDRDGVISANRADYVKRWEEFQFLPRALEGLALLTAHGCRLVIVTNQSVVGRGLVSSAALDEMHARMLAVIARHGGQVSGVLYCPHTPDDECVCRKPRPGLLLQARERFDVELTDAIVVGDHPTDLEAGRRAGCRSLLVLSGRSEHATAARILDDYPECGAVVPDLLAAAEWIVTQSAGRPAPIPEREPAVPFATAGSARP